MQPPRQTLKPALQFTPHDVPLHVAVPLAGTGHRVQDAPQVLTLLLDTHVPPQFCVPAGHVPLQADATGLQIPPQTLKPVLQATPHEDPLQVATPLVGTGQDVQEDPQALTLVFVGHMPLQLCVPTGQTLLQKDELLMQTPLHSLRPVGHCATHLPFEQVTVPLRGATQRVHDTPQVATELLPAQVVPHTCCPVGHVSAATVVSSTSELSPSSVMQERTSNKMVQVAATGVGSRSCACFTVTQPVSR